MKNLYQRKSTLQKPCVTKSQVKYIIIIFSSCLSKVGIEPCINCSNAHQMSIQRFSSVSNFPSLAHTYSFPAFRILSLSRSLFPANFVALKQVGMRSIKSCLLRSCSANLNSICSTKVSVNSDRISHRKFCYRS